MTRFVATRARSALDEIERRPAAFRVLAILRDCETNIFVGGRHETWAAASEIAARLNASDIDYATADRLGMPNE